MVGRNINWEYDELVLAADLAARRGWKTVRAREPDVIALSDLLRQLPLHAEEDRKPDFRSPGSVRAKVENLRTAVTSYEGEGTRGGSLDAVVAEEFLDHPGEMHARALLLRAQVLNGTYIPSRGVFDPTTDAEDEELRIRHSAMAWLDRLDARGEPIITRPRAAEFEFEGRRVPLMDHRRGIWKPASMEAALSITTTKPRPSRERAVHEDVIGSDGLLRYEYQRGGPDHPDNVALRRAHELRLPLIWFKAVQEGRYVPLYPVFVREDEPAESRVVLALDESQISAPTGTPTPELTRQYTERTTQERLHQAPFRALVREAYDDACAVCGLRYPELLDAAHIIPDTSPGGDPVVENGLVLCKLHHQAYDKNLFGISRDGRVEVRPDVLHDQNTSAMMRTGLQNIHGNRIRTPQSHEAWPDPARLDIRYHEFRVSMDQRLK